MRHAIAFLFAFLFAALGVVVVVPPKLCGQAVGGVPLGIGSAFLVLAFLIAVPTNARTALLTLREVWPFGARAVNPTGGEP